MVIKHKPVLLNEAITVLDPKPGEFFIDGTFGSGGHAQAILEKLGSERKLLAIDWEKTGENFADLAYLLVKKRLPKADGLLLDLGISSDQLELSGRGFSFQRDEPLLMNFNSASKPAKTILRELSERELATMIFELSQEKFAHRIAKAIKEQERIKSIETTQELVAVIQRAVPANYERGRIHPATRTFMALRMYVNNELKNLERVLQNLPEILKTGGRVAIISFHSLEDRLVKNHFRNLAKVGKLKILTKKPITPSREEIKNNPRARSAKLRAASIQ